MKEQQSFTFRPICGHRYEGMTCQCPERHGGVHWDGEWHCVPGSDVEPELGEWTEGEG